MKGALTWLTTFPVAVSASAQTAPMPADSRTRIEIAEFTKCLVRHRQADARRAVLEDWDSRKIVYRDFLRERLCAPMNRGMRFSSDVLRASLANHLIAADLGPGDLARVATAPPLVHAEPEPLRTVDSRGRPLPAARIQRQKDAIQRKLTWLLIDRLGECVARANPAAVPPLVSSPVASASELAALKAFGPQLPACVPSNVKLELDRSSLRGAIAVGYYRLAMAARQASGQGTER